MSKVSSGSNGTPGTSWDTSGAPGLIIVDRASTDEICMSNGGIDGGGGGFHQGCSRRFLS